MLANLPYYLLTVFGIGLVIFVHELGHFLAARAVGVRVEAFSIGFGKRLFGFRRGPTEYRIGLIPLGGYVKMAGEDPTNPGSAPDEFGSKTVWQRVLVISAGVIMNLLFALIAIPIAFSVGIPFESPILGEVEPGSPAWKAGLLPGDRIVTIDGKQILSFGDITHDVAVSQGPLEFGFERDGRATTAIVTPEHDAVAGFSLIGVSAPVSEIRFPESILDPSKLSGDERRSAEAVLAAGLGPEDRVLSLNGIPDSLSRTLWAHELQRAGESGTPLVIEVQRGDARREVTLHPILRSSESDANWQIGVAVGTTRIEAVRTDSVASRMGLRKGDRLRRIQGQPLGAGETLLEIADRIGEGRAPFRRDSAGTAPKDRRYETSTLRLVVLRDEKEVELAAELPTAADRAAFLEGIALESEGLRVAPRKDSPAATAGIADGDVLLSADGKDLRSLRDLAEIVADAKSREIRLAVRRPSGLVDTIPVVPAKARHGPALVPFVSEIPSETVRIAFADSFAAGFATTGRMIERVLRTLRSLVTGRVSSRHLGGVIEIFKSSVTHSQIGLMRGLLFLAMVSINLAILNILPIPVLDGGWLVFLLLEKIRGAPLSERTMGYFQWTGLVLVLALMLYATWNDLSRLFGWM